MGEQERVAARLYEKQQADMAKLATFVRVNGTCSLASSANQRRKRSTRSRSHAVMGRCENRIFFNFLQEKLSARPAVRRSFVLLLRRSSGLLVRSTHLAVDMDSRVALVGPNGCGKSTLVDVKRTLGTHWRRRGTDQGAPGLRMSNVPPAQR